LVIAVSYGPRRGCAGRTASNGRAATGGGAAGP
jgi:hypothetical protein